MDLYVTKKKETQLNFGKGLHHQSCNWLSDQAVWWQDTTGSVHSVLEDIVSAAYSGFMTCKIPVRLTVYRWEDRSSEGMSNLFFQYPRTGKSEPRAMWSQSLNLLYMPSIPYLKVPKEGLIFVGMVPKRPLLKCITGGHSRKIILFYTCVSGSFNRVLSDIFKMQLTPPQCDWWLLAIP